MLWEERSQINSRKLIFQQVSVFYVNRISEAEVANKDDDLERDDNENNEAADAKDAKDDANDQNSP